MRVRNRTPGPLEGALWVVPLGVVGHGYEPARIRFTREDQQIAVRTKVTLPILRPPLTPDLLLEFRRDKPAPSDRTVTRTVMVRPGGFQIAEGLRVGYIAGFGSWLDDALNALGVEYRDVTIDVLNRIDHSAKGSVHAECDALARFDTIIIDERAYLANQQLQSVSACLFQYVLGGGNLIVLFQQPGYFNGFLQPPSSPFAIALSHRRIARADSALKILEPEHVLLSKPNKISETDFAGWQGERAVFLPERWSTEYTALLESADPREEPQRGGLLVARYGAGSYIYTSLDWRRQLRSMNPGAFRVLANLVSYPMVGR